MNTKSTYFVLRGKEITNTLAQAPQIGKRVLEPLKSSFLERGVPMNILEDHQILENDAEVHTQEADLWLCLEGTITFICGGELVDPWFGKKADGSENPTQLKAKKIKDGEEIILQSGDWLWIPAGVPHQHTCPNTARLVIIKVPHLD